MQEIFTLIEQNWDSILLGLAVIALLVLLLKHGERAKVAAVLFALVTRAEKELGTGTGALKLSTVVGWVYERIPAVVRVLFTQREIERMVEKGLEKAKEKWATNPNLQEYIAQGGDTEAIM